MTTPTGLTKDNAEDLLRTWLEAEGLVTRATPDGLREAFVAAEWVVFAEIGSHQVTVTARPDHPAIAVAVPFQLSPPQEDAYVGLSQAERRRIEQDLELTGSQGPFVVQKRRPLNGASPVFFIVRYLYPENLTRQLFIDSLHAARNVQRRMAHALADALDRATAYAPPPPPPPRRE